MMTLGKLLTVDRPNWRHSIQVVQSSSSTCPIATHFLASTRHIPHTALIVVGTLLSEGCTFSIVTLNMF